MNSQSKIIELVEEAVEAKAASRHQLAEAIESVFKPIPIDTEIKTKSHLVKVVKVYSYVRQCAGASEYVSSAKGVLVDHRLVALCDTSYWDGRNWQLRCSALRLEEDEGGTALKLAPASTLKSLARELPEALAQWITDQHKEAAEVNAMTEGFAKAVATLTETS
jgi:hypothetical protein